MITIFSNGIQRVVTEESYKTKWKPLGFKVVDEEDLEDLTVKELKELLDEQGIDYDSKMKKNELLALLESLNFRR